MVREVDPLLPHNESAPEISRYGTRPPPYQFNTNTGGGNLVFDEEELNDKDLTITSTTRSAISTFLSALSFALLFAIVLAILVPGSPLKHDGPIPGTGRPIHAPHSTQSRSIALPTGSPTVIPGIPAHPNPERTIDERAKAILTQTPLIDGHNDLAILLRYFYQDDITGDSFRDKFENGGMEAQVDLPRLKKGMIGGAFWSAFVSCPENASDDFSDEQYATAVSHTIQQIDLLKRLQRQYPHKFTAAGSSLDTMQAQFHDKRSLFGPLSIEGLHQVSQTSALSTLRLYYELGIRAATLTWNCHNAFADAALISSNGTTKIAPYHRGGVTAKGKQLIQEMNRLGMLVDLSHTSYWTQKSVLSNGTSRSPAIFTHSSVFEICPHPRNVKDDILDLVKDTNGLVMVNFSPDFISCVGNGVDMPEFLEKNNTLHQVARHIVYIGDRIGYDHVGLGSDFDGIQATPEGLDGVDKFPDLIAELLRMGVSDKDAAKLAGGNILRVWRRAEQVSKEMQEEGILPGQDDIKGMSRDEL